MAWKCRGYPSPPFCPWHDPGSGRFRRVYPSEQHEDGPRTGIFLALRPSPTELVTRAPMTIAATDRDQLGQYLLQEGLISREQLVKALAEQKSSGHRLGYVVVRLGMVEENEVTKILARLFRMPAVDLSRFEVEPTVLKLIPADIATKQVVLPLKREGRTLTVAMADPTNIGLIDDLKFITRYDLFPVLAGEQVLRKLLERHYESSDQQLQEILQDLESENVEVVEETEDEVATQAQIDDAPVVKLINGLLIDAVRRGASDIHIEPFEHEIRVRYRVDGALLEVMKPPVRMKAALTSRVKILSQLNIAERRVPQDGRLKLKFGKRVIDFRVSTLPVLFGEKIVLRILDKGNLTLDLSTFGFAPKAEQDLMSAIANPYGMVLVTGPTGSGKTTTLYSALSKINDTEVNIMTAEDPVEYNLMGINQVLVRTEIGLTFAAALRAFLRRGAHRAPGALHAPHERRGEYHHPYDRHGHRAVQCGQCRQPGGGPAAGAAYLQGLSRRGQVHRRRARAAPTQP